MKAGAKYPDYQQVKRDHQRREPDKTEPTGKNIVRSGMGCQPQLIRSRVAAEVQYQKDACQLPWPCENRRPKNQPVGGELLRGRIVRWTDLTAVEPAQESRVSNHRHRQGGTEEPKQKNSNHNFEPGPGYQPA